MAAAASDSGGSGLRADARENRARILAAATATFTEHGDDASLTRIATTAGVGIGTLYRHFPTREHLVEAVHRDRVETVSGKASVYLATMGAAAGSLDREPDQRGATRIDVTGARPSMLAAQRLARW